MNKSFKITKVVAEPKQVVDVTALYIDFSMKYRNVFITQIDEETFIFRALGRSEFRDILKDSRFDEYKKEDIMCAQCLLYPDPDTIDWDNVNAGLPTKLLKEILKKSYLDDLESRTILHSIYRSEMFDLDNQITCIINEAFPNFDIEEIEAWDVDKTTKYLSRAEWKLHNLRGIGFVEPQGDFTTISNEESSNGDNNQRHIEPDVDEKEQEKTKTIRGGSKKNKLTPEKMREREEFLKKFPEFANDDILMSGGIKGMEQDSVDTTPPALRIGW